MKILVDRYPLLKASQELQRLHTIHAPKYKGCLGEPNKGVIKKLSEATEEGIKHEEVLFEAVDALLRGPCLFWACNGYDEEPEDMVTCCRCRAIHDAFKADPSLRRLVSGDSQLQAGYPVEGGMSARRRQP